jgi:hypothetical protein
MRLARIGLKDLSMRNDPSPLTNGEFPSTTNLLKARRMDKWHKFGSHDIPGVHLARTSAQADSEE